MTPPSGTGQPIYSRFALCSSGCGIGYTNTFTNANTIEYKVTTYQAGMPEVTLYKDKTNGGVLTMNTMNL